jgi:hypothetical protein
MISPLCLAEPGVGDRNPGITRSQHWPLEKTAKQVAAPDLRSKTELLDDEALLEPPILHVR